MTQSVACPCSVGLEVRGPSTGESVGVTQPFYKEGGTRGGGEGAEETDWNESHGKVLCQISPSIHLETHREGR